MEKDMQVSSDVINRLKTYADKIQEIQKEKKKDKED